MEPILHRFRNNASAIRYGNPGWNAALENHLIDIKADVVGDDRLRADDGHIFVNLCSCSYLGLHNHPALIEGAIRALERARVLHIPSSRIRIRLSIIDEFEERLSALFRARSICAVTASAATAGVLPLVASGHLSDGQPPLMVFDKHCHFSMNLIKPICADETQVLTAPHNDMNFLEDVCKKHPRVAYVADGVYSLGGAAPIRELLGLQDRYGLFLYFDDSHSLSVYGERGEGYVRSMMGDELNPRTVIVASLHKAFGASGGVIMLGPAEHESIVIRFGGPMGWSQNMNTAGIGAGLASCGIHESPELGRLQRKLRDNLALLDERIDTAFSGDPFTIRLIHIGDEERAAGCSGLIYERGFYTSAVFFPIIEKGRAGLRVMIRADNRAEDILAFCDAVRDTVDVD